MPDDFTNSTQALQPPKFWRPEDAGFTHEQLLHTAFGGAWKFQHVQGFGPGDPGGMLGFASDKGRLACFSLDTRLGEISWRCGVEGEAAPLNVYFYAMRAALGGIVQLAGAANEFNYAEILQGIARAADHILQATEEVAG